MAGCSPPQPLLLQICSNLHASPLVQPRTVLKRMHISVPVVDSVTASEAGPRRLKMAGQSKHHTTGVSHAHLVLFAIIT